MTSQPLRTISVRPRAFVDDVGLNAEPCSSCSSRPDSVCSAISDQDLKRLAAVAIVTEVKAGATFIEEGEPADDFHNITAGVAKLYKLLPDGRRQIIGFARAGDFLGLAVSRRYGFTAEALEPMRFCRFPRRRLSLLLDDFPAMERRLLEAASTELVAAQEQMLLLGRKTARERVASFLLAEYEHSFPCGHGHGRIRLAMTRGDIADYLGLTIETVSRSVTRLKTDRLIAIPDASTLIVLDRAALAQVANGFEGG
jgi:CRP/FNR family transcriptional regulator